MSFSAWLLEKNSATFKILVATSHWLVPKRFKPVLPVTGLCLSWAGIAVLSTCQSFLCHANKRCTNKKKFHAYCNKMYSVSKRRSFLTLKKMYTRKWIKNKLLRFLTRTTSVLICCHDNFFAQALVLLAGLTASKPAPYGIAAPYGFGVKAAYPYIGSHSYSQSIHPVPVAAPVPVPVRNGIDSLPNRLTMPLCTTGCENCGSSSPIQSASSCPICSSGMKGTGQHNHSH